MKGFFCLLLLLIEAAGCSALPKTDSALHESSARLQRQLIALGQRVDDQEAARLAQVAVEQATNLALEYRAMWPPWVHNTMVNGGFRDRGLCFHWANDLFLRLHALGLRSLDLHLAVARMDTSREHNAVVVTASGQPFESGLVLDAWRNSGALFSGPAITDKYPWKPLPPERIDPEIRGKL
jgi:hypothetical protein